jgi:hypothetical protein
VALTRSGSVPPGRTDQVEEPPTRRWWPVLLPLVLVVVAVSVYLPSGRHQWALSLVRQPAHYTILQFNRATNLPAQSVINQPITVSFAIGNREGHAVSYQYVLTQSPSSSSKVSVLGRSAKTVAPSSTWTVTTTIRPSCQASPCRVQVSLPGHPEKIDFLVSLRKS